MSKLDSQLQEGCRTFNYMGFYLLWRPFWMVRMHQLHRVKILDTNDLTDDSQRSRHRINCFNAGVEDSAYIIKKHSPNDNCALSDFIFWRCNGKQLLGRGVGVPLGLGIQPFGEEETMNGLLVWGPHSEEATGLDIALYVPEIWILKSNWWWNILLRAPEGEYDILFVCWWFYCKEILFICTLKLIHKFFLQLLIFV